MPKIIDFHIHPPGPGGLSTQEQSEMAAYFRSGPPPATTEEMAEYYPQLDIFGVLFAIDDETVSGPPARAERLHRGLREALAEARSPAFGTVDPWKGKAAVKRSERVQGARAEGPEVPSFDAGVLSERRALLSAVGDGAGARADRAVPHRHDGRRRRPAGRRRRQARSTRARSRTSTTSPPTSRS